MLILDTETWVIGRKPNAKTDKLRFFAAKNTVTGKRYFYTYKQENKIRELIAKNRIIITYNGDHYDIPLLQRHGLWTPRHLSVDLFKIMQKRGQYIGGDQGDKYPSMKKTAKLLELEMQKTELDYDLLKKDEWTAEELDQIREYTLNDIEVTHQIYNKLSEYFEPFKEYLNQNDNRNMRWLTTTISSYAYKAICNLTGLREEYDDKKHKPYPGGHVIPPIQEEEHEHIKETDYVSLYPNIMIQCNLHRHNCTCCREEEKWRGTKEYKTSGAYCTKKLGPIAKVLQMLLNKKEEYKKNGDTRHFVVKIIINSAYGITGDSVFKNIYNYNAAKDCTMIGAHMIKKAKETLEENGYPVLYGDTDSCYVKDTHPSNPERLQKTLQHITRTTQQHLPFPNTTHQLKKDKDIQHIWFIPNHTTKGEKTTYKKKHYIYTETNERVTIKGLPIIKRDATQISIHVYKKYIEQKVKKGELKTEWETVKEWVYNELRMDMGLGVKTFRVDEKNEYKVDTSIQYSISSRYGPGKHELIPNNIHGVGKSTKYCTIQEFQKRGLTPEAIQLKQVWKELSPFIKNKPLDTKRREEESLLKWTNIR